MLSYRQAHGKQRCRRYGEYRTQKIESGDKPLSAGVANAVVDTVLGTLHGELDRSETVDRIRAKVEGLQNGLIPTPTLNALADEAAFNAERYLDYMTVYTPKVEAKVMDLHGLTLSVRPDIVLINRSNRTVEAIAIAYRKPNVTQKGRKMDGCVESYIPLYALLCYAENKAMEMWGSEGWTVSGTFHFLKRADDKSDISQNNSLFDAKGGKNIIQLAATPDIIKGTHDMYKEQITAFLGGIGVTDEVCENCEMKYLCKYHEAPIPVSKLDNSVRGLPATKLSREQARVVRHSKGVLRINAGAGSGKTTTVVLNVCNTLSTPHENILMLTFTNAAAKEMAERIRLYAEAAELDYSKVEVTTFHGFGNSILQKEYERFGYSEPPMLIDDIERTSIISELLSTIRVPDVDYRNFDMALPNCKGALHVIAYLLNICKKFDCRSLDEVKEHVPESRFYSDASIEAIRTEFLPAYNKLLTERGLMEYADQEACLLKLIKDEPDYLDSLNISHIIVDEFQDTDAGEFEVLKAFWHSRPIKSLIVVGDDSQSIYGFRETSPEFMLNFWEKMGIAKSYRKDIVLSNNYRSTPEILAVANRINERCGTKPIKAVLSAGGKRVRKFGFEHRTHEVDFVCDEIAERIKNGEAPESICIIAYKKSELERFAEGLRERGIAYQSISPENCFNNSNIQAALALPDAPTSTLAMHTVLNALAHALERENDIRFRAEYGEKVREWVSEGDTPTIVALLRAMDPAANDELFQIFLGTLETKRDILAYLRMFKRFGENTAFKRVWQYGGVTLSTAHSSKGLEWNTVYASVSGFDGADVEGDLFDERTRLLYVTVTRARKELTVTAQDISHGSQLQGTAVDNRFLEMVEV